MPTVPIVDTMIGFPLRDTAATYEFITRNTKGPSTGFPAAHLFGEAHDRAAAEGVDPVDVTLDQMDTHGIAIGMVGVASEEGRRALLKHPDRFVGSLSVDPKEGMDALRAIRSAKAEFDIRAVDVFPAGTQVAINAPLMYPVYAACIDLDLPIFLNAGVPGPRLPMDPQKVEYLDQVMFDFPELTLVTRHGCEPWTALMVSLMLKWPGLHYSTSAFAPRFYASEIVNYANTRGASKVLYGGYYPYGLALSRIAAELPGVPFRDHVWEPFLHGNAARILKLA